MEVYARIYTWRVLPLLGLGLRTLLQEYPEFQFEGGCDDAEQLIEALSNNLEEVRQVVIIDFTDGFTTALAQVESWRARCPRFNVIFLLPAYADDATLVRALRAGANGYLLQTASTQMVLKAITTVSAGQSYLGPEITPLALSELRRSTFIPDSSTDHLVLSEREQMLVQLSADGLSHGDIADVIGLAEKTIRNLWSGLFDKLGMADRTQVILWAVRTGQVVMH